MKDILETIVTHLVENQDAIQITEKTSEDGKSLTLEVRVAPEDMGRIIGKQGKIARSIRTVIKSMAVKEKQKINVEFLD